MPKEHERDLVEHLAEMTAAGVPLHVGLRAAAMDTRPSRTARQLDQLASSLSQAESLEAACAQLDLGVRTPVGGLIRAGIEAGQLDQVLAELVRHERARREIRHELFNSLAYPLAVLILFLAVALAILLSVVPDMAELYRDFETELPASTRVVLWLADPGIAFLGQFVVGLTVIAAVTRFLLGPVAWRRVLNSAPLFGPVLQWSGTCEWAALMRVLVNARLPLPEALAMASRAVRDPNMAAASSGLSAATLDGHSLSGSLMNSSHVPLTLGPLIAWGEQNNQLAEALAMAVEIFRGRIRLRSKLLQNILPPVTFIIIAALAVGLAISIALPLVSIMQFLS